ncbi:hypothetical protein [Pseudomonas leptonychotis]|uniref:hypothetical protein n=1 Tax=Pseudomonas leptonychotis TaxID=2448482 RepID=UPI00386C2EA8
MNWRKHSPYLLVSDSGYKVAKYISAGAAAYRASINGEFIGQVCTTAQAAQAICENHQSIMGVAA